MTYEIETTLSGYIKRKLGLSLKQYAKISGLPVSTLQSRWKSQRGRIDIENAVFKYYVTRFDEL
jgi:predicted transcriptional regulator